jgi:hypothetical protein
MKIRATSEQEIIDIIEIGDLLRQLQNRLYPIYQEEIEGSDWKMFWRYLFPNKLLRFINTTLDMQDWISTYRTKRIR